MVSDIQIKEILEKWDEILDAITNNDLGVAAISLTDLIATTITATASQHLAINGVTGKDIKFKLTDAAGARKIIVLDSADAEVGTIDSNGLFTAAGGFAGALTGNVTGDLTGDVTGDVTGAVTGNVTGNVTGDVTGNLTGSVVNNADASIDFAAGHADYTLSATEKKAKLLVVTNADQAANIIGPAENRDYILRNASGAAITIKKAAGTGVAVANGKTAAVMYSSTVADYVRVTADATH